MLYIYIYINYIEYHYVADMIISAPFQLWSWGVLKLWLEITLNNQIVRFVCIFCVRLSAHHNQDFASLGSSSSVASFTRLGSSLSQTQSARREPQLTDRRSGAAAQRRSNDLHMSSRYIWYNESWPMYTNVRVALHSEFAAENKAHSKALSSLVFRSLYGPLWTFWTWENSTGWHLGPSPAQVLEIQCQCWKKVTLAPSRQQGVWADLGVLHWSTVCAAWRNPGQSIPRIFDGDLTCSTFFDSSTHNFERRTRCWYTFHSWITWLKKGRNMVKHL